MKQRRKESGFALLMVFLLAACVAIMLYVEVPRVAFEAERQKELLLTDRGNQFKRAIQVFQTDRTGNPTGRYPASIDELENFNNRRYLRRKYVDPMTGKDEWRLIHTSGVAGVFPDSVSMQQNQNQAAKDSGSAGSDYIKVLQSFDAVSNQQQQGGASAAMRRRPSDAAGGPGSTDGGTQTAGGSQGSNGDASGAGSSGSTSSGGLPGVGGTGQAGGGPGSGGPGATAGKTQPCTAYIGTCAPTTTAGGGGVLPGQAGNSGSTQTGGLPGGFATGGGMTGGINGQPGSQANPSAQTAAAGMIQNILTSPRPGGMPTNNPGTIVGGGIAGVASKFKAEGIMVINDRTAINEWEYIYDSTKYRRPGNPLGGGPGVPVNGQQGGAAGGAGGTGATGVGTGPGGAIPGGSGMTTGGGRGQ